MFKAKHTFGKANKALDAGKTFLRGFTADAFRNVDKFRNTANPLLDKADNFASASNVRKVHNLLAAGEDLSPHLRNLHVTDRYDQGAGYGRKGIDYAKAGMSYLDRGLANPHVQSVRKMVGAGRDMPRLPHIPRNSHGPSYGYSVANRYR